MVETRDAGTFEVRRIPFRADGVGPPLPSARASGSQSREDRVSACVGPRQWRKGSRSSTVVRVESGAANWGPPDDTAPDPWPAYRLGLAVNVGWNSYSDRPGAVRASQGVREHIET